MSPLAMKIQGADESKKGSANRLYEIAASSFGMATSKSRLATMKNGFAGNTAAESIDTDSPETEKMEFALQSSFSSESQSLSPLVSLLVIDISRKPKTRKPTEDDIQDAKLVYHHPSNADARDKRNASSLFEGLISLTGLFTRQTPLLPHSDPFAQKDLHRHSPGQDLQPVSPRQQPVTSSDHSGHVSDPLLEDVASFLPLRLIHSSKFTIAIEEVEANIWMVLTVRRRPLSSFSIGGSKSGASSRRRQGTNVSPFEGNSKLRVSCSVSSTSNASITSPDGPASATGATNSVNYHTPKILATDNREDLEEAANDRFASPSALSSVLLNCYQVFRLLHGPFQQHLSIGDKGCTTKTDKVRLQELHDLLEDFIPSYFSTIEKSAPQVSLLTELNGIYFAPVQRTVFLQIQFLFALLHRAFPQIRYMALLFKAHLIYYSLPEIDMACIYNYLVYLNGEVSNKKLISHPFGRMPTAASQPGGGSSPFGRANPLNNQQFSSNQVHSFHSPPALAFGEVPWLSSDQGEIDEGFLMGPASAFSPTNDPSSFGDGFSRTYSSGSTNSRPSHASAMFLPTIYLSDGTDASLSVLLYQGLLMIYVVENSDKLQHDANFYMSLKDSTVGLPGEGRLRDLLRPINNLFGKVTNTEDVHRFAYFNSANRAIRISNRSYFKDMRDFRHPILKYSQSDKRQANGTNNESVYSHQPISILLSPREICFVTRILGLGHGIYHSKASCIENSRRLIKYKAYARQCAGQESELYTGEYGVNRILMKSGDIGWLIASKSMEREFFLFLSNRNMPLSECRSALQNFGSTHFSHIWI